MSNEYAEEYCRPSAELGHRKGCRMDQLLWHLALVQAQRAAQ